MTSILTQKQKDSLIGYLSENLAEIHNDPETFAGILIRAAESDDRFHTVLMEWLNRKTRFSEIVIHGYSLNELASVYLDRRLGILVALRLLWDEYMGLHDICLCIGQSCIADSAILSGKHTKIGIIEENGWYLYASDPFPYPTALNMGGYSLYQVCEAEPGLIELVTADIPAGSYALRVEGGYTVFVNGSYRRKVV